MEINSLLNDDWIKESIQKAIYTVQEISENTAQQNLWDTLKITLRRKFKVLSGYIKISEYNKWLNDITQDFGKQEKEKHGKKLIKLEAKINEIEI